MKTFILFFISILILSCSTNAIKSTNSEEGSIIISNDYFRASDIDYQKYKLLTILFQEWKHAREEEEDSIQIYRPSNSQNFPSTRFRGSFEFYKDGRFKYLYLAPNDAHYFRYGTWGLSKKESSLIGLFYSSQKMNRIKIIQLNNNILSFISLGS